MTVSEWSVIVGFVLPILVAVVNRETWKPAVKAGVALLSSVLAGTVTALLSGSFTGANWATAIGFVFAASQVSYSMYWKKSSITDWIEQAVNIIAAGKSSSAAKTE